MEEIGITMESGNTLMVSFSSFLDMLLIGKIRVKDGTFEYYNEVTSKYVGCSVIR